MPSVFCLHASHRYLAIPTNKTWDEIAAAATHKRSSLKATGRHGVVGPRMAFIGPHPDAGTMRILVQVRAA